jgi:alkanesulfonate monooxygenase SsuD/methylene tetrahydromethanopterin reductase-like flavin-dependent oxidoreductase (luciferase family)
VSADARLHEARAAAPDLQLNLTLCEPAFGTPLADQFAAGLEMAVWADRHGFGAVRISEHHGSEDGYVPAPTEVGAAVAAVTERIGIRFGVILLPLHHPLRVAEELAVVDQISRGRVMAIFGGGYRPQEFAMFGRDLRRRPSLMEQGVAAVRAAWTGEPFDHDGTTVRVTPRPYRRPGPPILLGGASEAAARRAARIADGFDPGTKAELWKPYFDELRAVGRTAWPWPRPGAALWSGFVSADPQAAWRRIAPHARHEMERYGQWLRESGVDIPRFREGVAEDELRRLYPVLDPEACVAALRPLGPDVRITLHPLLSGLDPEVGWETLRLMAGEVLPALADPA